MNNFILIIFSFLAFSCEQPTNPTGQTVDKEFVLNYGRSIQLQYIDTFFVSLLDVLEDSRCPKGYTCFWEGNAKITLNIDQRRTIVNTTLDPKEVIYIGKSGTPYRIKLLSVSPYPELDVQRSLKDYSITFIVRVNEIQ